MFVYVNIIPLFAYIDMFVIQRCKLNVCLVLLKIFEWFIKMNTIMFLAKTYGLRGFPTTEFLN